MRNNKIIASSVILHYMFVVTMLLALVFGVLLPGGLDTASAEEMVVSRQLPNAVTPGQSFEVTITFTIPVTANKIGQIGVVDNAPIGWGMEIDKNWCTPIANDAVVKTYNHVNYVWFNEYVAGTKFNVMYKVIVPADAAQGDYLFTGNMGYKIGGGATIQVGIGGQSQIQVNALSTLAPSPTLTPMPKPTLTPTPAPTVMPTDDGGNDGGMPWWGWLLMILGAVVVLGIVGFRFSSRRTTKK